MVVVPIVAVRMMVVTIVMMVMIVAIVMMMTMRVAIPRCGWSSAADCNCAENAYCRSDLP